MIASRLAAFFSVTLATTTASAAGFDVSLGGSLLDSTLRTQPAGPVSSGVDLSLSNRLFNLAVDYDFQVNVPSASGGHTEPVTGSAKHTARHFGASLNSALINELLRGDARLDTKSVVHSTTGAYNHRIAPTYSRQLADLATLDLGYQYLMYRPSSDTLEESSHGYSLGLKGSAHNGRLHWRGAYNSTDIYRAAQTPLRSSETVSLHWDYTLLPQMRVSVNSAISARSHAIDESGNYTRTEYGAGVHWTPSKLYAVNLAFSHTDFSHGARDALLRRGSVSWFPRQDLSLSLNYGDVLVEGSQGVLLNTKLDLGRF